MIPDPYIPEQVVDPEDFVGRCEEIENFKTFLDFSIKSKSRNIAIVGDWGIGKTALLRKFEEIAIQNDSPSARFDVRKDMSLLEFQQRLLLEVKTALSLHEKLSAKAKTFLSNFDVSMGYAGISVKKERDRTIDFRQKLLEMWNGLRDSVPAVLVMLDNAEGLKQIPGANEELRNIFQRLSEYNCKYVLVIAGKPDLFAGITSIYEPFARFFNSFDGDNLNYSNIAEMSDTSKKKIGTFLSRLTEKDLIKKIERGQYELFHPLFKEYLKNFVIGSSLK